MKNHLLALKKYDQERDWEGLHQYLNELSDDMLDDSYQIWTGNRMLDMILNQKTKDAKEKETDMQIETEVFATLPFSDREIISLFGNLLDNAIEACEKLEEEKRMVKIEVRKHHSMFMLIVENSCEAHAQVRKGIFRTTKKDDRMHGYGIHNVRKTVKNRGGQFQYGSRGENVYVKILIPLVI